jgi:hypothetical protein
VLVWIHYALVTAAALCFALSVMYAIVALTKRPQRARRAARVGAVGFALALLDGLGRIPIALASAEQTGDVVVVAATTMNLVVRNGIPVAVWGLALFARWRGWLADLVFATAVLIAAAVTLLCYLIPV